MLQARWVMTSLTAPGGAELDSDKFLLSFRLLLVLFRRELPLLDVIVMWEVRSLDTSLVGGGLDGMLQARWVMTSLTAPGGAELDSDKFLLSFRLLLVLFRRELPLLDVIVMWEVRSLDTSLVGGGLDGMLQARWVMTSLTAPGGAELDSDKFLLSFRLLLVLFRRELPLLDVIVMWEVRSLDTSLVGGGLDGMLQARWVMTSLTAPGGAELDSDKFLLSFRLLLVLFRRELPLLDVIVMWEVRSLDTSLVGGGLDGMLQARWVMTSLTAPGGAELDSDKFLLSFRLLLVLFRRELPLLDVIVMWEVRSLDTSLVGGGLDGMLQARWVMTSLTAPGGAELDSDKFLLSFRLLLVLFRRELPLLDVIVMWEVRSLDTSLVGGGLDGMLQARWVMTSLTAPGGAELDSDKFLLSFRLLLVLFRRELPLLDVIVMWEVRSLDTSLVGGGLDGMLQARWVMTSLTAPGGAELDSDKFLLSFRLLLVLFRRELPLLDVIVMWEVRSLDTSLVGGGLDGMLQARWVMTSLTAPGGAELDSDKFLLSFRLLLVLFRRELPLLDVIVMWEVRSLDTSLVGGGLDGMLQARWVMTSLTAPGGAELDSDKFLLSFRLLLVLFRRELPLLDVIVMWEVRSLDTSLVGGGLDGMLQARWVMTSLTAPGGAELDSDKFLLSFRLLLVLFRRELPLLDVIVMWEVRSLDTSLVGGGLDGMLQARWVMTSLTAPGGAELDSDKFLLSFRLLLVLFRRELPLLDVIVMWEVRSLDTSLVGGGLDGMLQARWVMTSLTAPGGAELDSDKFLLSFRLLLVLFRRELPLLDVIVMWEVRSLDTSLVGGGLDGMLQARWVMTSLTAPGGAELDSDKFLLSFRLLLVLFRRELPLLDVIVMWEVRSLDTSLVGGGLDGMLQARWVMTSLTAPGGAELDSDKFLLSFRLLLVLFRRELPLLDVIVMWEVRSLDTSLVGGGLDGMLQARWVMTSLTAPGGAELDSDKFLLSFRLLLVLFRRELPLLDVIVMWEVRSLDTSLVGGGLDGMLQARWVMTSLTAPRGAELDSDKFLLSFRLLLVLFRRELPLLDVIFMWEVRSLDTSLVGGGLDGMLQARWVMTSLTAPGGAELDSDKFLLSFRLLLVLFRRELPLLDVIVMWEVRSLDTSLVGGGLDGMLQARWVMTSLTAPGGAELDSDKFLLSFRLLLVLFRRELPLLDVIVMWEVRSLDTSLVGGGLDGMLQARWVMTSLTAPGGAELDSDKFLLSFRLLLVLFRRELPLLDVIVMWEVRSLDTSLVGGGLDGMLQARWVMTSLTAPGGAELDSDKFLLSFRLLLVLFRRELPLLDVIVMWEVRSLDTSLVGGGLDGMLQARWVMTSLTAPGGAELDSDKFLLSFRLLLVLFRRELPLLDVIVMWEVRSLDTSLVGGGLDGMLQARWVMTSLTAPGGAELDSDKFLLSFRLLLVLFRRELPLLDVIVMWEVRSLDTSLVGGGLDGMLQARWVMTSLTAPGGAELDSDKFLLSFRLLLVLLRRELPLLDVIVMWEVRSLDTSLVGGGLDGMLQARWVMTSLTAPGGAELDSDKFLLSFRLLLVLFRRELPLLDVIVMWEVRSLDTSLVGGGLDGMLQARWVMTSLTAPGGAELDSDKFLLSFRLLLVLFRRELPLLDVIVMWEVRSLDTSLVGGGLDGTLQARWVMTSLTAPGGAELDSDKFLLSFRLLLVLFRRELPLLDVIVMWEVRSLDTSLVGGGLDGMLQARWVMTSLTAPGGAELDSDKFLLSFRLLLVLFRRELPLLDVIVMWEVRSLDTSLVGGGLDGMLQARWVMTSLTAPGGAELDSDKFLLSFRLLLVLFRRELPLLDVIVMWEVRSLDTSLVGGGLDGMLQARWVMTSLTAPGGAELDSDKFLLSFRLLLVLFRRELPLLDVIVMWEVRSLDTSLVGGGLDGMLQARWVMTSLTAPGGAELDSDKFLLSFRLLLVLFRRELPLLDVIVMWEVRSLDTSLVGGGLDGMLQARWVMTSLTAPGGAELDSDKFLLSFRLLLVLFRRELPLLDVIVMWEVRSLDTSLVGGGLDGMLQARWVMTSLTAPGGAELDSDKFLLSFRLLLVLFRRELPLLDVIVMWEVRSLDTSLVGGGLDGMLQARWVMTSLTAPGGAELDSDKFLLSFRLLLVLFRRELPLLDVIVMWEVRSLDTSLVGGGLDGMLQARWVMTSLTAPGGAELDSDKFLLSFRLLLVLFRRELPLLDVIVMWEVRSLDTSLVGGGLDGMLQARWVMTSLTAPGGAELDSDKFLLSFRLLLVLFRRELPLLDVIVMWEVRSLDTSLVGGGLDGMLQARWVMTSLTAPGGAELDSDKFLLSFRLLLVLFRRELPLLDVIVMWEVRSLDTSLVGGGLDGMLQARWVMTSLTAPGGAELDSDKFLLSFRLLLVLFRRELPLLDVIVMWEVRSLDTSLVGGGLDGMLQARWVMTSLTAPGGAELDSDKFLLSFRLLLVLFRRELPLLDVIVMWEVRSLDTSLVGGGLDGMLQARWVMTSLTAPGGAELDSDKFLLSFRLLLVLFRRELPLLDVIVMWEVRSLDTSLVGGGLDGMLQARWVMTSLTAPGGAELDSDKFLLSFRLLLVLFRRELPLLDVIVMWEVRSLDTSLVGGGLDGMLQARWVMTSLTAPGGAELDSDKFLLSFRLLLVLFRRELPLLDVIVMWEVRSLDTSLVGGGLDGMLQARWVMTSLTAPGGAELDSDKFLLSFRLLLVLFRRELPLLDVIVMWEVRSLDTSLVGGGLDGMLQARWVMTSLTAPGGAELDSDKFLLSFRLLLVLFRRELPLLDVIVMWEVRSLDTSLVGGGLDGMLQARWVMTSLTAPGGAELDSDKFLLSFRLLLVLFRRELPLLDVIVMWEVRSLDTSLVGGGLDGMLQARWVMTSLTAPGGAELDSDKFLLSFRLLLVLFRRELPLLDVIVMWEVRSLDTSLVGGGLDGMLQARWVMTSLTAPGGAELDSDKFLLSFRLLLVLFRRELPLLDVIVMWEVRSLDTSLVGGGLDGMLQARWVMTSLTAPGGAELDSDKFLLSFRLLLVLFRRELPLLDVIVMWEVRSLDTSLVGGGLDGMLQARWVMTSLTAPGGAELDSDKFLLSFRLLLVLFRRELPLLDVIVMWEVRSLDTSLVGGGLDGMLQARWVMTSLTAPGGAELDSDKFLLSFRLLLVLFRRELPLLDVIVMWEVRSLDTSLVGGGLDGMLQARWVMTSLTAPGGAELDSDKFLLSFRLLLVLFRRELPLLDVIVMWEVRSLDTSLVGGGLDGMLQARWVMTSLTAPGGAELDSDKFLLSFRLLLVLFRRELPLLDVIVMWELDSDKFLLSFRLLLVLFRRELPLLDVIVMWEVRSLDTSLVGGGLDGMLQARWVMTSLTAPGGAELDSDKFLLSFRLLLVLFRRELPLLDVIVMWEVRSLDTSLVGGGLDGMLQARWVMTSLTAPGGAELDSDKFLLSFRLLLVLFRRELPLLDVIVMWEVRSLDTSLVGGGLDGMLQARWVMTSLTAPGGAELDSDKFLLSFRLLLVLFRRELPLLDVIVMWEVRSLDTSLVGGGLDGMLQARWVMTSLTAPGGAELDSDKFLLSFRLLLVLFRRELPLLDVIVMWEVRSLDTSLVGGGLDGMLQARWVMTSLTAPGGAELDSDKFLLSFRLLLVLFRRELPLLDVIVMWEVRSLDTSLVGGGLDGMLQARWVMTSLTAPGGAELDSDKFLLSFRLLLVLFRRELPLLDVIVMWEVRSLDTSLVGGGLDGMLQARWVMTSLTAPGGAELDSDKFLLSFRLLLVLFRRELPLLDVIVMWEVRSLDTSLVGGGLDGMLQARWVMTSLTAPGGAELDSDKFLLSFRLLLVLFRRELPLLDVIVMWEVRSLDTSLVGGGLDGMLQARWVMTSLTAPGGAELDSEKFLLSFRLLLVLFRRELPLLDVIVMWEVRSLDTSLVGGGLDGMLQARWVMTSLTAPGGAELDSDKFLLSFRLLLVLFRRELPLLDVIVMWEVRSLDTSLVGGGLDGMLQARWVMTSLTAPGGAELDSDKFLLSFRLLLVLFRRELPLLDVIVMWELDSDKFLLSFRLLLVLFRRELPLLDVIVMWEVRSLDTSLVGGGLDGMLQARWVMTSLTAPGGAELDSDKFLLSFRLLLVLFRRELPLLDVIVMWEVRSLDTSLVGGGLDGMLQARWVMTSLTAPGGAELDSDKFLLSFRLLLVLFRRELPLLDVIVMWEVRSLDTSLVGGGLDGMLQARWVMTSLTAPGGAELDSDKFLLSFRLLLVLFRRELPLLDVIVMWEVRSLDTSLVGGGLDGMLQARWVMTSLTAPGGAELDSDKFLLSFRLLLVLFRRELPLLDVIVMWEVRSLDTSLVGGGLDGMLQARWVMTSLTAPGGAELDSDKFLLSFRLLLVLFRRELPLLDVIVMWEVRSLDTSLVGGGLDGMLQARWVMTSLTAPGGAELDSDKFLLSFRLLLVLFRRELPLLDVIVMWEVRSLDTSLVGGGLDGMLQARWVMTSLTAPGGAELDSDKFLLSFRLLLVLFRRELPLLDVIVMWEVRSLDTSLVGGGLDGMLQARWVMTSLTAPGGAELDSDKFLLSFRLLLVLFGC
ncbi:unnamed protein product [Closterium sp. Naga37s-1]|nr:unnamed protein product [Closterium sp. Naga37s-1]